MKTKFTKGDWRIELTKCGSIDGASVYHPHGFLTSANVIPVDETRLEGESWIDMRDRTKRQRKENELESIANMHLIKTSPKMYKMLESLLENYGENDPIGIDIDELLAEVRGEL